jgi:cell division protein FtsN
MSSATMSRNESAAPEASEFELVLGNKQLLSVFFIVVVLLGVFFTMGYIVGRNSAPVDAARSADTYERGNAPSSMPKARQETPASVAITEQQPAPTDAPAARENASEPEAPAAAALSKPVAIPAVTAAHPEAGRTYLQVVSVAKPQADSLAEVLAKRGFRAFVAPGPDERTFRVLVGPAADIDHLGKLKAELEAVGMKPFVKKY